MKKYKIVLLFIMTILVVINSQAQTIKGQVFETAPNGNTLLFGVNVYTPDKVYGTTTDLDGLFTLDLPVKMDYDKIIVSFIGYQTKEVSIGVDEQTFLEVELSTNNLIGEVEINRKKLSRSYINPYNVEILNSQELKKAACCNLAESFETNAAIDVQFSDAVTGAKKIKMLGLDGYYTQTMFENTPSVRGLSNSYGLLFIPGPFMQSIAINKGAGSVTNGYEAITGQINYEYKKPENSERFFLNLFASRHGQFEVNSNVSHRFNDVVSTGLLVHHSNHQFLHDENDDNFQDMPLNARVNVMNRWRFNGKKNMEGQLGFNYIYDERQSGQFADFFQEQPERLYQTEAVNRKYDAFAKTGFLFNNQLQSIGIQYRYTHHEQDAWYGDDMYRAREDFANINFIFQTAMSRMHHSMKMGWSYQYDNFDEEFRNVDYDRKESVPGFFTEYTYQDEEKLSVIGGLRADFHNLHGVWLSPRFNLKYNFKNDWIVKIAAGKGYRTANILAENTGAMASSREFLVAEDLGYESAWNYGAGIFKEMYLGFQPASISIDFYRTDFTHQVIADFENPREVSFYNLNGGKSYANSFQIETSVEATAGLDIKLAYKLDDVHTEYKSGIKRMPYIPMHKILLTVDYETKNKKWLFGVTGKFNSKSRLPSTDENPLAFRRELESKPFFTLNSQVTAIVKQFEFYVGGENLTNYWQENPVIASTEPFGDYFDSSMVWGPLGGMRLYGGLRWTVPYKNRTEN